MSTIRCLKCDSESTTDTPDGAWCQECNRHVFVWLDISDEEPTP